MTSKTASLLTDPEPHSHFVYPSADEHLIAEAVGTFASSGLRKREAVVLVTTKPRREAILHRLNADGLDVWKLQANGHLQFLDAAALLSAFLADGMPDADLFKSLVGYIIERASVNAETGKPQKVRIFGEMVSLLYMASNVPAAGRLEEFWNEMVKAHSISLFCAYSLEPETSLPQSLLDCHSHDLSVASSSAFG